MTLIAKIRKTLARHALHRKFLAEFAAITDAELKDLDLSRAKLAEMSYAQARAA